MGNRWLTNHLAAKEPDIPSSIAGDQNQSLKMKPIIFLADYFPESR